MKRRLLVDEDVNARIVAETLLAAAPGPGGNASMRAKRAAPTHRFRLCECYEGDDHGPAHAGP